jgi:rare lipoprotein A
MVGKPYMVAGRWYSPRVDTSYDKTGRASWYGSNFHGRLTANGEIFDQNALTAAHPTLPLPSYVRVTNLDNRRSIIVRVNDRGPFVADRLIDLSKRSADMLGYLNTGVASVRVQYVGPAPLEGDDTRILLASLDAPSALEQGGTPSVAYSAGGTPAASPRRSEPAVQTITRLFTDPLSIFAYADGQPAQNPVNVAFAATEAVAAGADLAAWRQGVDIDARQISLDVGTFANPETTDRVARAFALIAAVDTVEVQTGGAIATRVHLYWLKPGVTRADIVSMASSLGLEDVAFPD